MSLPGLLPHPIPLAKSALIFYLQVQPCVLFSVSRTHPFLEGGQGNLQESTQMPLLASVVFHQANEPLCLFSLLQAACCSINARAPSCPSLHHRDWALHCGTAKFICCQTLYIPHNSASQAFLCMCLFFTIRKTDGEGDSPDTLEGWALAPPQQNLHVNSISDLRLYIMHNTPAGF